MTTFVCFANNDLPEHGYGVGHVVVLQSSLQWSGTAMQCHKVHVCFLHLVGNKTLCWSPQVNNPKTKRIDTNSQPLEQDSFAAVIECHVFNQ
eukprot:4071454-Amphidinium_carterae.1